jgi:flagellar protein FliT
MTEEQRAIDQTRLLEQVFALTQAIEQAASLADWQQAARLAEERSPLVMSIRAQQQPAALALIRQIQTIDVAVMEEARQARAGLETEYRAAMERSMAASQYHHVALL